MSTWSGFVTIFSEWSEDENHAESSLGKGEGGMQRSAGHILAPAISWGGNEENFKLQYRCSLSWIQIEDYYMATPCQCGKCTKLAAFYA